MGLRTFTTQRFRCDGEDCLSRVEYNASTKRYGRKRARRDGWSVHSGGVYCPKCNTKPLHTCPECGSWNIEHKRKSQNGSVRGTCRECREEVRFEEAHA